MGEQTASRRSQRAAKGIHSPSFAPLTSAVSSHICSKHALVAVQALSDAHTYLFEERERLLKLQSDNDELRLQEVEDRKRIQHLLAMHSPLEQEITYNREGQPSTVTVFPRQGQENIPRRANQQNTSERVMRTVYLPAANADNLMLRIESLQAQLSEQVQWRNIHAG